MLLSTVLITINPAPYPYGPNATFTLSHQNIIVHGAKAGLTKGMRLVWGSTWECVHWPSDEDTKWLFDSPAQEEARFLYPEVREHPKTVIQWSLEITCAS